MVADEDKRRLREKYPRLVEKTRRRIRYQWEPRGGSLGYEYRGPGSASRRPLANPASRACLDAEERRMFAESAAMVGEDSRGYRRANRQQSSSHCGFHDGAPRRRMEPMNRIMQIE